jgi:hypothetical protein
MGVGKSKPTSKPTTSTSDEPSEPEVILTKEEWQKTLNTKITQFKEGIDALSKNDKQQLRKLLTTMPVFTRLPQPTQSDILKILSATEKSLENFENGSDVQLEKFIENVSGDKVIKFSNTVLQDEFVKNNPDLKQKVEEFVSPLSKLHSKYKFYQYKYIQTNILMLVMMVQMQDITANYALSIKHATLGTIAKQKKVISDFVRLASDVNNDASTDSPEVKDITQLANNAYKQLQAHFDELTTKLNSYDQETGSKLVEILLQSGQTSIDDLQKLTKSASVESQSQAQA